MSAEQIATMIPFPTAWLEDVQPAPEGVHALLLLLTRRRVTAEMFGEDWSGPGQEFDRLEHRRTLPWDPRYWPDEFEEDDW